jgi:hypothetical protein
MESDLTSALNHAFMENEAMEKKTRRRRRKRRPSRRFEKLKRDTFGTVTQKTPRNSDEDEDEKWYDETYNNNLLKWRTEVEDDVFLGDLD